MWDTAITHKMNVCSEEKRIKTELIKIFEMNRCLWDTSCVEYRNNAMKDAAWRVLLSKCNELYPVVEDIVDIKNKFANWRTAYKREVKKVRESIQRNGFENRHKPQLWYFNLFSFLEGNGCEGYEDQDDNNTDKTDPLCDDNSDAYLIVNTDVKEEFVETKPSSSKRLKPKKTIVFESPPLFKEQTSNKKKRESSDSEEEEEPKRHKNNEQDTNLSPFVLYMDQQLKSLTKYQRSIAEKLISDVIFLAKTENLSLESKVEAGRHLGEKSRKEEAKSEDTKAGQKDDSGNILKEYLLISE